MHGTARHRRQTAVVARLIAPLALGTLLAGFAPDRPPAFAASAAGPRVLVYNIHAGKDAAEKPNLDGVAALVKSTRADFVMLQEVDRQTRRSGGVDQVAALARATAYDAAFAPSLLHYDGGEYGVAILAKSGVGFHSTYPLPVLPPQIRAGGSQEPRVALLAFSPGTVTTWRLVTTHLDPADGPARAQEVSHLVELFQDQSVAKEPIVIGGDFNSTPDNAVLEPLRKAGLRDAWLECGSGPGFTDPADTPSKRIDYLFIAPQLHCSSAEVLDTRLSDHRPLLVTLAPPAGQPAVN
jgi:endonuclease/exonuclease/phosphatase family metal-dependent hydrolase